jgi:Putative MetA-pathway of phenol degradation
MRRFLPAVLVPLTVMAAPAGAQSIRHVFRTAPSLVGLPGLAASGPYQNAADVILEQAIRNLPLYPAASSAYTYRWDAAQDTLVRVDDAVSAWPFTERGQTLGEGLLNIGVTWGYYDVDSYNGHDLGHDPFPVSVCCGSKIRYQAATDLLYTVGTFNITYGLLDDLDLNIAIPIVTLDMGLDVTRQDIPGGPVRRATVADEHAGNISDMLLRAKYRIFETSGELGSSVGAAGVRVRLPSGNAREGLGTGYGEIGPYFALSTNVIGGWLDSDLDAGVDAGIGNLRWSSAHYSWELDVHAPRGEDWWSRLALATSLLGRSEFTSLREATSISGPHVTPSGNRNLPYLGIDAARHDYLDATFGVRVAVWRSVVLSLGVFKALNNQGVRPDGWSPVGTVEGTF